MKTQLNQKISSYINMFETKTRDNGNKYVILKDKAKEELKNAIHNANGDRLPNDFIYSTFLDLLQTLDGFTIENPDYLDEIENEVIDSNIDIYTKDLTAWLASDINNVYYLTEAIQESNGEIDGFQALQQAQSKQIYEVWQHVKDLLIND